MEPQNLPKPEKRQRVKTTTKRKKPLEQEVLLRKGCWGPQGPSVGVGKLPDGGLGGPLKGENLPVNNGGGMEEWKGEGWQQRNGHVDMPPNGASIIPASSSGPSASDPENPMSLPPQSNNSQLGHDSSNNNDNNGNNNNDLLSHGGSIKTPGSLPPTPSSQHSQNQQQQQNPQQNPQLTCRPLSNMGPNGLVLGRGRPQSTGMPEGMSGGGTGGGGGPGGHFMSQQSQIFVFSTGLANEAAEVVQRGQCRSIVDFHLDTPATRQFLQNFPLGANSFNRPQSMPPFLDNNNMAKFPSKEHQPPPMPFNETGSALANVELWVQQQNASLQEGPFSPSFGPSGNSKQSRNNRNNNSSGQRWLPSPGNRMSNNPQMDFGPDHPMHLPPGYMPDPQMPPGRGMMPASLDENLTPEQLQRREEQLAQLQKIKNMLFPEKRNEFGGRPHPGMYGPPRPGPDGMMGMIRFPPGHPSNMMGPGGIGMMEPPHDQMMGLEMDPAFFNANGPFPPGLPPNWENMSNEEREWFKLQHEYYMDRQKHQLQMSRNNGGPPPPPGYFGEMGPQSRMPGPHSPVSPSFAMNRDPSGFFFQGPPPPGMNFPPNGPGPHPPDFHPDLMQGGMPEGMFFGPNGPMGPRMHHPHDPMAPMGPFGPGGPRFPNICKPKRRRNNGAEKSEDIYRHLQPAPPPEQFCSLNLIEGQEVTITRQLNLAYQDPSDDQSPSQQNFNNNNNNNSNNSQQQSKKKKKSDNNNNNNNNNDSNKGNNNNNQRHFDFDNKMSKPNQQQHSLQKAPSMEKQEILDSQSPSANFNNNINSFPHGAAHSKGSNSIGNMLSPSGMGKGGMEDPSEHHIDSEGMQAGMFRSGSMNENSPEDMLSNNQQGVKSQAPDPSDKSELMDGSPGEANDGMQKNFENDKMMKSLSHQHSVEKQEMPSDCSPPQSFNSNNGSNNSQNNNNNNHNNNNHNNNSNNTNNNNNNIAIGSGGMTFSKSSSGVMNNITSPTLASLAKGVESLSGRIEQDMLQGGLFRTVQMPENEGEFQEEALINQNNQAKMRANEANNSSSSNNNANANNGGNSNNGNNHGNGGSSSSSSNNNNNNNNQGDHGKSKNNNNHENNMNNNSSNKNNRGNFEFFNNEKMAEMKAMQAANNNNENNKRSPHMFPPDMKGPPQHMMSPRMHAMIGNASVQIEASAPNTIQYMPARPPTEQGSNTPHQMPPSGYNGPDYGPIMSMDGNPMFDNNFMPPPNFDGCPMGGPNDMNGPVGPAYGNVMARGFNSHNMPGFSNGQNGPIGFDPQNGPIFEGSLPPGMGGPMIPGYNGPPPPGFSGQPSFPNGHQGHMHPGMMPGFDGHCGPMGDFDGPMPGMPPYGNFGPRGQCGPMMGGGFHPGGPMGMNHPEMFGHRMPMMPGEGKMNENPRGKEGGTKKEKERKKRSESKKAANNRGNMVDKPMPGPGGMGNNMRPGSALMMSMGCPEMGMRPGADMMMGHHPGEMMMQEGMMMREGGMGRPGMGRLMMPDMEGMICRNGPMNPMMDLSNGGDMFHGPMMMEGDQFNNGHPPPPFDMMRPESNYNGGGIISGDPGMGR